MSADFDTGQRFGAYKLGKLIGRGGMGVVYQAEHVHLQRVVALKLLTPDLSGNEDFRARFLRESRIAAALEHPSVVTVYDAGDVNGVLYIAMRFVRGTDLSQVLAARGPLAPSETLMILGQVASALDAAHGQDLVHRDVKPANVMIEGERCYLTDFGLTKRVSSDSMALTSAGQFLGTVDYVAPEQVEGGDCDGRADGYALGCVLYECLTGSRPYPRDAQVAILFAHLREPPPRPTELRPDLPAAIDGVLARAMAKRKEDRFATCGAMVDAARDALGGLVGEAPTVPLDQPTAAIKRVTPAPRRRRTGLIAAAIAVPAVIAAVVILALSSGGGESSASGPHVVGKPIEVGRKPVGVAISDGFVWVANTDDDTVSRIDPDDGSRKDIRVGDGPYDLGRGAGSIWVANELAGTVTRIDSSNGHPDPAVEVGTDPYFLTVKGSRLYVANAGDDRVQELDANTGEANGSTTDVGREPRGIAPSRHAVWVANSGEGTVSEIVGGKLRDTVRVGRNPTNIAFGADAIWVANTDSGTVSRIVAPPSGVEVKNVRVGDAPYGIGFGHGYAWVANSGEDTVMRLDPESGKPVGKAIRVPGRPYGITAAGSSIWVTSNESNTLTRIDP